ncbi:MAG: type VI secretion system Vgr family protein, partial [Brucella intermedia]
NCKIWQNKSTKDVVNELFEHHGLERPIFKNVEASITPREYSVQWNETDLDYLLRRAQEDGLFFWFHHEPDRHVAVFADGAVGWDSPAEIDQQFRLASGSASESCIDSWVTRFELGPAQISLSDWNFQRPSSTLSAKVATILDHNRSDIRELFIYPARAMTNQELEHQGSIRMRSHEVACEQIVGSSTIRSLQVGQRFRINGIIESSSTGEEWVAVRMEHHLVERIYENDGEPSAYSNSFTVINATSGFPSCQKMVRPVVLGVHSAIVAGPSEETIHTDEYGRIKLWFPWDREARRDGSDTCWVRVVQSWSGTQWGGQIIPRIGMEVMVAFIDGDPDKPVVVGTVPNSRNMAPYELPKNKTRSVFRTSSCGLDGFNELSFEDRDGHQEIFLHAQRDKLEVVNAHSTEIVGGSTDQLRSQISGLVALSQGWGPHIREAALELMKQADRAEQEKQKKRS